MNFGISKHLFGDTIGGRRDYRKFKSPFIIVPRLETLGKQVEALGTKEFKIAPVAKMLQEDTVEVSNIDAEALFDPKELKACYEQFLRNDEVGEKEIVLVS